MPHASTSPSDWVRRFAPLVPEGSAVLDLAAGSGRHAELFLTRGYPVTAVDIDVAGLVRLDPHAGLSVVEADLEGAPWPLPEQQFGGVIVTNYLWRALFGAIADAVAPGGVLIYETFMEGNAQFGKPSNPDFLLRPGELHAVFAPRLDVVAFEQGEVVAPRPAVVQRLCARRGGGARLPDGAAT